MADGKEQLTPKKSAGRDFLGRYREIVSDPLNLLIPRHPMAGVVEGENVILHNGHRVAFSGPMAYYRDFSSILIINRGVHEPLEEYAFYRVLEHLPEAPTMVELGAYWGHYSMWLKQARSSANIHLVEPDNHNLSVGKTNCALNGYDARFTLAGVGPDDFVLDRYMTDENLDHLTILHCDIQGAELELMAGAKQTLSDRKVYYWFVSTHSQRIHKSIKRTLLEAGYRIEVSADFNEGTTSFDGFILAAHPDLPPIFGDLKPFGRTEIAVSKPQQLVGFLTQAISEKPFTLARRLLNLLRR